jgi:hypothetical protein
MQFDITRKSQYVSILVEVFRVVTLCSVVSVVVGYLSGPCCLHLHLAATTCSAVVRYQHFRGLRCAHLHLVMPCKVMVEYQRFRVPCCLHLQGEA